MNKIQSAFDLEKKQNEGANISFRLVHTGQHYDKNLSDTFFEELNIPHPNVNLEVKSGSQAEQTAAIMIAFEKEIIQNPCDLVLVVGDVNSTMACAIVAKKQNIKVAHVEAGIRSGDRSMPEEINRMVTDSITDYFFTTSETASENLLSFRLYSRVYPLPSALSFQGKVLLQPHIYIKPPALSRILKPPAAGRRTLCRAQSGLAWAHRRF